MQGVHVLSYATTEVMQLVINNYDVGQHPIHLHGRRFYVLARGGKGVGAYNPNKFALNTKTPYVRDTVTIEHNSFVVIRFADKNPGLWLFHCHIDWHKTQGLALVLNELPAPVAVPVASAPPGKVPVGIIVGFIVGALGALLIAGAVAYHFLPELFRMPSNPRAAARAKVAELRRQERDMDVPLLYPVGAPPPPPPPVTDEVLRRAEELRRASLPGGGGSDVDSDRSGMVPGSIRPGGSVQVADVPRAVIA